MERGGGSGSLHIARGRLAGGWQPRSGRNVREPSAGRTAHNVRTALTLLGIFTALFLFSIVYIWTAH